jgi:hypothetical protein
MVIVMGSGNGHREIIEIERSMRRPAALRADALEMIVFDMVSEQYAMTSSFNLNIIGLPDELFVIC